MSRRMFKFTILTVEKTIFEGDVYSIEVPGADGYFEILTHHAPLIALIQPGKLEITPQPNGPKSLYAVSGGFFEVSKNNATLFADDIELASAIDIQRAEIAQNKALKLIESPLPDTNLERANQSLKRAKNRIAVYLEGNIKVPT